MFAWLQGVTLTDDGFEKQTYIFAWLIAYSSSLIVWDVVGAGEATNRIGPGSTSGQISKSTRNIIQLNRPTS